MKVSIDSILGSARRINSQRQLEEERFNKQKKEVKSDTLSLSSKVNTRLDSIEREFRDIQSSLTKNQIIRNGIEELNNDYRRGGENQQSIMDAVTFEGNKVLRSYVGETITQETLDTRGNAIYESINNDVNRLKRLQVELDNIMASNLAGNEKVENVMVSVDRAFNEAGAASADKISQVRPDAVMRLIK